MRWVRSHLWPYRYYKKLFPRGARRRRGAYHLDPPTHTHDRATKADNPVAHFCNHLAGSARAFLKMSATLGCMSRSR